MWRVAGEWLDVRVRGFLKFMVEQCFWGMTLMNRYQSIQFGKVGGSQVNRFQPGVFYIPQASTETTPWYILDGKYKRLQKMLTAQQLPQSKQVAISTASSLQSPIPNNIVDYIYTDPPVGDAIKYGDLNLLIEAWHNLFSRLENEVLWDELKKKTLSVYSDMMRRAFAEYYRVLKPGRWMTVVFHNSKNLVWTAIQEAIGSAGFVVADVRTLDREQGSFNQVTAAGAVKQDLVISAYKPNGGLEERFKLEAGTKNASGLRCTHLKQLPVFVSKVAGRGHCRATELSALRPHGGLSRPARRNRAFVRYGVLRRAGPAVLRTGRYVLPARTGGRIRQEAYDRPRGFAAPAFRY
jgi:hypothetical protein